MDEAPWFRHYEEWVPHHLTYPDITLPDALDQTAERFPDRVALRFFPDARLPAPTMTYRQLQDATGRFATALYQLGVRKGDRIALMLPNCPQFAVAFYGALRTGDVARMDPDGFFHVVDRRKDMIDASGFKVMPREVEEALLMHPKIREAVVAGVPDAYRGESVKAFVVLKPDESADQAEVVEFCRLHLAAFKVPRTVEFRSELPKTMVGKYLRRVLVEEELAAQARPSGLTRDRGEPR